METNFNFKSQICTSKVQSERLLALGLKKETADMVWIPEVDFDAEGEPYDTGNYFERPIKGVWDYTLLEGIPAWSLHRLIEMADTTAYINEGREDEHELWFCMDKCFCWNRYDSFHATNLYDSLIDCIEWLIKEGYFNKEYLV